MNNIFNNAYFGKPFKTRDGRKAIYIYESPFDKSEVYVAYEDSAHTHRIMKDGHYWSTPNAESNDDIISEWKEEINEDELDKLYNEFIKSLEGKTFNYIPIKDAFKDGYRKAMEK